MSLHDKSGRGPAMVSGVKFNVVKSMAIFDALPMQKVLSSAAALSDRHLRIRTGFGLWPSRSGGPDGTGNGPGRAGSLGRNRALPYMGKIERGEHMPTLALILRIAVALNRRPRI